MNIIPHIFYPLTIGLIVFTYAFFKWPKYAIAGLIIAKPIIDLTRYYYVFRNINFLKIYAGLFVILGVIYILYHRPEIMKHSISVVWLIFLGLNFVSFFIITNAGIIDKFRSFSGVLTGFVALILFAHLFNFDKDKKFVLSIFIVAGIFPLLLWLIPVLLGNPTFSNDELRRIIGPYHGFMHFNFYALQTLICCLAYLSLKSSSFSQPLKFIASKLRILPSSSHCEPERSEGVAISTASQPQNFPPSKLHSFIKSPFLRFSVSLKSIFILFMLFVSIAMIYKCYSKTGWITLIVILLIWFVLQRKFITASLVAVITVIILFVNPFAKDFQKTFRNEIDYYTHGSDTKATVFRGRLEIWETGMEVFKSQPFINRLFGVKKSVDNPVNDYLRVLWENGILGFLSYLALLGVTAYFLIRKFMGGGDMLVLMSMLIFLVFIINSIGSNTMVIPKFQWFMWGTVGFILSKDKMTVSTKQ